MQSHICNFVWFSFPLCPWYISTLYSHNYFQSYNTTQSCCRLNLYYSTLYVSRLQRMSCLIAMSYWLRSFTSRFLHLISVCTSFRCTWLLSTQDKLYFKNEDYCKNNFDSKQTEASGSMSGILTPPKVRLVPGERCGWDSLIKRQGLLIRFF